MSETPVHPLQPIFEDVLRQVMYGKGERHGGAAVPFFEQQWLTVAKIHGVGFLTGQAQKKMTEAMTSGHIVDDYAAWEREMMGAIAYMGMSIIYERLERRIDPVV